MTKELQQWADNADTSEKCIAVWALAREQGYSPRGKLGQQLLEQGGAAIKSVMIAQMEAHLEELDRAEAPVAAELAEARRVENEEEARIQALDIPDEEREKLLEEFDNRRASTRLARTLKSIRQDRNETRDHLEEIG